MKILKIECKAPGTLKNGTWVYTFDEQNLPIAIEGSSSGNLPAGYQVGFFGGIGETVYLKFTDNGVGLDIPQLLSKPFLTKNPGGEVVTLDLPKGFSVIDIQEGQ